MHASILPMAEFKLVLQGTHFYNIESKNRINYNRKIFFFNIIFLHTFLSASKVYVYNPSVSLNTI